VLTSHVMHCDEHELAAAADECLNPILQAALAVLDAAGVLPGEEERRRLRVAIADYIQDEDPQPGRCRICGCTETAACIGIPLGNQLASRGTVGAGKVTNCSWADASHTLCTNPACLEKAGVAAPELVS